MFNFDFKNPYNPENFYAPFTTSSFSKTGGYPKDLPFDLNGMFEVQRNSLKALAEAQKIAISGIQAVARQQNDILSGMIESQSALISLFIQQGTPEEKIARHAKVAKTQYKHALHEIRDMQDTISKTMRSAADALHQSVISNLGEQHMHVKNTNALVPANTKADKHGKIAA